LRRSEEEAANIKQENPNRANLVCDLRSTYATRLSAGGVADEWVTQMLRQGDAQVFKKYSQMKLQMKREALEKLNCRASEMASKSNERMRSVAVRGRINARFVHGRGRKSSIGVVVKLESALESILPVMSGRSAAW
jgi:hypothetical protein